MIGKGRSEGGSPGIAGIGLIAGLIALASVLAIAIPDPSMMDPAQGCGICIDPDPGSSGGPELGSEVSSQEKRQPVIGRDIIVDWGDGEENDRGEIVYGYDGTGKGPGVSFEGSDGSHDYGIVCYPEGGGAPLDGQPSARGRYVAYIRIGADDPDFERTSGKGLVLGTFVIEKGTVEIVDFRYDLVDQGERMTMKVTMAPAGALTSGIVVRLGGEVLELESCIRQRDAEGRTVMTAVYDTSLGDIPAGSYRIVSVSYPGDPNHEPSGSAEYQIRIRSAGLASVPEEGGDIGVDPATGTAEVRTPVADVAIRLDDGHGGSGPEVHVEGCEVGADERISGADRTFVIRTSMDPDRIGYTMTATVRVDVPDMERPVVRLYDPTGAAVEMIGIPEYTMDSVTFSVHLRGQQHLRIAVTFVSPDVTLPDPDAEVPSIRYPTQGADGSRGTATVLVVAGCAIALMAILVLTFGSRSGGRRPRPRHGSVDRLPHIDPMADGRRWGG